MLVTPLLREGMAIGVDHDPPHRSPAVHREANRAAGDLRRPGGHRDRERAAVQRAQPQRELTRRWSSRRRPAEILSVISRSPTDIAAGVRRRSSRAPRSLCERQPVSRFRQLKATCSASCHAAHSGSHPYAPAVRDRLWRTASGRAMLERGTIHVPECRGACAERLPSQSSLAPAHGYLARRSAARAKATSIGTICSPPPEVRPFTDQAD